MKIFKTFFLLLFICSGLNAQTADEIIQSYFDNTGGYENWGNLEGVKMTGVAKTQGMDIPVEIYQLEGGEQLIKIDVQGQQLTQLAFDGETAWTTNFMTMKPEKSDSETTENIKRQSKDFPSPFYNYKEKGYEVEMMGTETMEGTEVYKIKLTQQPVLVNGKEEPNVTYYFFDTENNVIIASESEIKMGPMKGQTNKSTLSGYQEVDGLYFPFDLTMMGSSISIEEIQLNPEIDDDMFEFPEVEDEKEADDQNKN
ncbi:outer membrane lipoprotein-sorting protein [Christiangramia crocea]|uniref:Outer membrane lipoprotein-sorting protein n=1 Tax=Christiangramia crocea TaxID=2904124 RepID=A0A9X1UY47_9FLAO|nr:outer membrane lipoprotein-sorting protein [Gramella crocea]MCG9972455.1 outer membrane lipoprotein-sorting protein [Gramella crocea]